jgi:hypothetical protein
MKREFNNAAKVAPTGAIWETLSVDVTAADA